MTLDESEQFAGIEWVYPHFFRGGKAFEPHILDGDAVLEEAPFDGAAAAIRVDCQMSADLDWKEVRKKALELKQKGFLIYWDIYLGLFQAPLHDKARFLSLSLALEHFRDTLWKEFRECSFGVSLYRGEADFASQFPWNEEQHLNFREWIEGHFTSNESLAQKNGQANMSLEALVPEELRKSPEGKRLVSLFCRNAVSEYLHLLAGRLPDEIFLFLLLDASKINDPLLEAQLLSRASFDRFHLAVRNRSLPQQGLVWQGDKIVMEELRCQPLGFCLPPLEKEALCNTAELRESLEDVLRRKIPCKVIPEEFLITEWDGLEWIIAASGSLGSQGKRKLQGFCAAGGVCITIGDPIGLANEISIRDWMAT